MDKLWHKLRQGLYTLVMVIVPALIAYDVYFQWRTPALDFYFDATTGLVREVPADSYADWAGLHPGDIIQTVDGVPFREWIIGGWHDMSQGPYFAHVERLNGTQTIEIEIELPAIPVARLNFLALLNTALVALIFWSSGAILLLRRPQQPEVHLIYLLSQVFAVILLFPLAHPPPYLAPRAGLTLSSIGIFIAAPLLLHYYLTFPVRLGDRLRRRWWLIGIYGLAILSLTLWLNSPRWRRWGAAGVLLEITAAIIVLVYVYVRRASPNGRRRLRVVVLGNITAALPGLLLYILPQMVHHSPYIPEWLLAWCLVIAPISYLYATLRYNLFGIDRLLNRALVYILLSLSILSLYLGPFLLIYRLAPNDWLAHTMVAAGLTMLVGLAFDWSRTQIQRLVDHLFYGGWYDYPGVVETVSAALARTLNREQLVEVLTRQIPEMMQLHPGHLWIGEPDETLPPEVAGTHLRFTFSLPGRRPATWIVGTRCDKEEFTAADRRILNTLADQAEIALNNVLLVEALRRRLSEIREAQRQLLRSREEERARLSRDLHDGPIQTLVGLNMQLGLFLTTAETTEGKNTLPDERVEELKAMRAEVQSLLKDLRQICSELRPPMLDTLGLGASLRALAQEWSTQNNISVTLDMPADHILRTLPEEVAVNFYRVAQEALSNIARHAGANRVTLQLVWRPPTLLMTVQDNGRGFKLPADLHDLATTGHFGLVGMQERADLIGGTLTVKSDPGQGTSVQVVWQTPSQEEPG